MIFCAIAINFSYPNFFEYFSKSKEELLISKAINSREYNRALVIYLQLAEERINDERDGDIEMAAMYEEMAKLFLLLDNKEKEKAFYLKSLNVKKQLKKNDISGFSKTHYTLGLIAEEEKQYDQAQMYYEQSLSIILGNAERVGGESQGIISGLHQTRLHYIRLNNAETITIFRKLGSIHAIKSEYTIAKQYYVKALTASKITFGEDSAETLAITNLIKLLAL
jgi:tetratricopeptide (TPR) repeat protein